MTPASARRRIKLVRDVQEATFNWLEEYACTKVQHINYHNKRAFLDVDKKLSRAVRALENHIHLTGEDALYTAIGGPKSSK